MKKIALTALTCMALSLNSYAQTKKLTDTIVEIQEVIVTANLQQKTSVGKINMPPQYLPLSISTINISTLEQQGIVNLQDAIRFTPGATIRTSYGAYQQLQVRGYDYMPIMIDGVRDERTSITNSAPLPDISSIENLELLKGPASVLYGHSAVGGILNITRKAPTKTPTLHTLFSYGSWNNKRAMIDLGGKLFGPLNYRAVINWQDNEGYRYTNDKRFSGYAAIAANLKHNQELELRGAFNRDQYGTEIGLPPLMPEDIYRSDDNRKFLAKGEQLPHLNPRNRYNNESDFMIHNGSNLQIKYSKQISPSLKIENRTAYNYDNIDYFSTEELSYRTSTLPIYPYYYQKNNDTTKHYIDIDSVQLTYPLGFAYTVHTLNQQIEASGKIELPHHIQWDYLAGYNFVLFNRDTYRRYGSGYTLRQLIDGPGLFSITPTHNPHSMGYMDPYFGGGTSNRNTTHGIYIHNLIQPSTQLKIMLSGRFDTYNFKTASITFAQRIKERQSYKNVDYKKTNTSAFTYRIGAVYLPNKNTSIYASASNFYMPYRDIISPTIIYINTDGKRFYPDDASVFKPQTGYQAEIGIRITPNRYLQASSAIYYIKRNNEKKTLKRNVAEDGINKTVVGIVGQSESKGMELEIQSTPIEHLKLSLGYSLIHATITDIKANEYLAEDPQKGLRQLGVPQNTFLASTSYTFHNGVIKNLTLFGSAMFTDKIYRDTSRTIVYPAYWLIDGGCSYRFQNGLGIRLNVNNIFNEKYISQSLGTQLVPSNPRNYLLSITYTL